MDKRMTLAKLMKRNPIGREEAALTRMHYKRADTIGNVRMATRLFHALSVISPNPRHGSLLGWRLIWPILSMWENVMGGSLELCAS
jgi:hypothetical protein